MKRKGFTLIELLAVIIILAVIALIATPIVLNVVDNAKESARKSSVAGYADATRMAVYDYQFANKGSYPNVDKTWADSNVTVGGEKVDCEEVHFSNTYGVVLHKCSVGTNEKKYCHVSGKTYEDCEDTEYKTIYDSLGNVVVSGKPVVEELKKQYNESNTVGLLKDDTGYYYKGTKEEVANNFVWFGGHLWRVISIDNDNNLIMITQQPITNIQPASAVWTTQAEYEASYINHWLNSEEDGVFYKSLEQADKDKIQNSTFNVGIYNNVSEITTTQKVGLLDEVQYAKAGGKGSFLGINDYWWLGNRHDVSKVRYVLTLGDSYGSAITFLNGVRPVIKISDLTFTAGKGTLDNPYRENSKTTNTSNIKVGEYISIPTTGNDCGEDGRCLFRVVSKDNDSIKVTLNGLLPEKKFIGNTITYSGGKTAISVTTFAETINSNYRYNGTNKTFGIGMHGDGANYTTVQSENYIGTEGLPVIGEMFTSNDLDLSTSASKDFVNVNVVENSTITDTFWTMNAYSTAYVLCLNKNGSISHIDPRSTYGVRPVLFLNQGLTFTSGEGTAENPFMLGE